MTPAAIEVLVNHPAILPNIAPGLSPLKCFWAKERNGVYVIGDERGAVMLVRKPEQLRVFSWHWLATPECRGKAALDLGRRAIETAFTTLRARTIVGRTPRDFRAARIMNRALGAKPVGKSVDIHGRPCIDYALERANWVTSSDQSLTLAEPLQAEAPKPRAKNTRRIKLQRRPASVSTI